MTIDYAKRLVGAGAAFGEVFGQLADPAADGDELRRFFCFEAPAVDRRVAAAVPAARLLGYTGSVCHRCQGSRLVRTGPCERCEDCGETSGGCS